MNNYKIVLEKYQYLTQTEKKYFPLALEYSQKHNTNSVKVNRIKFYFDYKKNQVMIGTSVKNAYIYKMEKV